MMGIKFGGGERADVNFAKKFEESNHDVEFIIGREFRKLSIPLETFSKVAYIKTPYLRNFHYKFCNSKYMVIRFLSTLIGLKLDLILFQLVTYIYIKRNMITADIFQICGLPWLAYIIEKSGFGKCAVRWPGPIDNKIGKKINMYSLNWGAGCAYESIAKYDKTSIDIPNSVDIEKYKKYEKNRKLLNEYSILETDTIFIFVGRLVPIKNVMFLVESFKLALDKNKNIKLIIIGEGQEETKIKTFVRENNLGEKIILSGAKYDNELLNHYNIADVFCITSTYENFSNSVLEAMSFELPVIATSVGYLSKMVINNVNGFLIESNDNISLCNAILNISIDKNLRNKIGKTNREKMITSLSWNTNAKKILDQYCKLGVN